MLPVQEQPPDTLYGAESVLWRIFNDFEIVNLDLHFRSKQDHPALILGGNKVAMKAILFAFTGQSPVCLALKRLCVKSVLSWSVAAASELRDLKFEI